MRRRAGRAAAALLLAFAVSFAARGEEAAPSPTPTPVPAPAPVPKLFDTKTTALSAGVVVGIPALGYLKWWKGSTTSTFKVADEGWFEEDTYAGGADKASHIFWGYFGSQVLRSGYRSFGKTPAQARGLAFAVVTVTGLLIEIGDGYSRYGFAWEDLTANTIGAALSYGIDVFELDDTVGLRVGHMKAPIPPECCRYGGYGDDYSKEMYTLDLKLAGFLPRLGAKPGLARFLLLSGTYQSLGYRFSPPENRRREIGIEVGLNLREILAAVGVPGDKWWGKVVLGLAKYFRVPYTAIGFRYDLNSGTWSGPNSGYAYDPGYILYD